MSEDQLVLKLESLPEYLRQEVFYFADFLFHRYHEKKHDDAKPVFGSAKGKYAMADDFDELLEDFKGYM
ncbi:MAG TPA: DUF2281 domain-containing protein [Chitinophagaceae bacterium]|nr:DUF2281 domain-containing protein [Chitinophagaceae bacterium]